MKFLLLNALFRLNWYSSSLRNCFKLCFYQIFKLNAPNSKFLENLLCFKSEFLKNKFEEIFEFAFCLGVGMTKMNDFLLIGCSKNQFLLNFENYVKNFVRPGRTWPGRALTWPGLAGPWFFKTVLSQVGRGLLSNLKCLLFIAFFLTKLFKSSFNFIIFI